MTHSWPRARQGAGTGSREKASHTVTPVMRRVRQPHRRPDTALSPSGRVMRAVSPVTVFSAAR